MPRRAWSAGFTALHARDLPPWDWNESMKRRPIHEIRRGLIKVSIWRKRTRSGVRHTVSVVRLFRNGEAWKESTLFGRDDLPVVRLALDEAHSWIYQNACQTEPVTSNSSSTGVQS